MQRIINVFIFITVCSILSCGGKAMVENGKPLEKLSGAGLEKPAQAKIFFGHKSVGYNIVAGMEELMHENSAVKLKIVEGTDPAALEEPVFLHASVEQNGAPEVKLQNFVKLMENGIGNKAQYAGLKFCYVDITANTDVEKLFGLYRDTMSGLKQRYTDTVFIHFTDPLMSIETGPKAWVKQLMGKAPRGTADNAKREQFNALLRKEYAGREPLFDLAMTEATAADGSRERYEYKGKPYYALRAEYTDDGGHLNALGRKVVAEQFLVFLAGL